ncbi:MAG: carboxysome shell protein, partial [Cyanobacteriota bacterium]|nr:carboxysome shell protein [Cyanobacteriota bacterium]
MVRSKPSRGGRALAPTAPTRRQLQSMVTPAADPDQGSAGESLTSSSESTTRLSALQRRQALTVSGKAARLSSGSASAGRLRSKADQRRPVVHQQPGWVRRGETKSRPAVNLSRTTLPWSQDLHPLTDQQSNQRLQAYELEVKGRFDRIVPLLKQVSALQHEPDFLTQAQRLARAELGFDLPDHILELSWVRPLDMRALFAWCVFQSHQLFSERFFQDD